MSLRSYISNLQHSLAGELLLDVEVVILHVGRFDVAVESKSIALEGATSGRREYRTARDDRGAQGIAARDRRVTKTRGQDWGRPNVVVCRSGIEKRRVWQVTE